MQSSDGQLELNQENCQTSLLTETELDIDSKVQNSHKQSEYTPKSTNQKLSTQIATALPSISEIKNETQQAQILSPELQFKTENCKQTSISQNHSPQQLEQMQDVNPAITEVQTSERPKEDPAKTQNVNRNLMFDLGAPSEGSGQVAAMLDLELNDIVCGNESQQNSSIAITSSHRNNLLAGPKNVSFPKQQVVRAHQVESGIGLSETTPPYVKMKTALFGNTPQVSLAKSNDIIDRCNGSVGGGQVQSEQQNSIVTSNAQAVSVQQIQAAQNDSSVNDRTASGRLAVSSSNQVKGQSKQQQQSQANDDFRSRISSFENGTQNNEQTLLNAQQYQLSSSQVSSSPPIHNQQQRNSNSGTFFNKPQLAQATDRDHQMMIDEGTNNADEDQIFQFSEDQDEGRQSIQGQDPTNQIKEPKGDCNEKSSPQPMVQNSPQKRDYPFSLPENDTSPKQEQNSVVNSESLQESYQQEKSQSIQVKDERESSGSPQRKLLNMFNQVESKLVQQKKTREEVAVANESAKKETIRETRIHNTGIKAEMSTQTLKNKGSQTQETLVTLKQREIQEQAKQVIDQPPKLIGIPSEGLQVIREEMSPIEASPQSSRTKKLDERQNIPVVHALSFDQQFQTSNALNIAKKQVVVRSPFEQEIFELLAMASEKPKTRLQSASCKGVLDLSKRETDRHEKKVVTDKALNLSLGLVDVNVARTELNQQAFPSMPLFINRHDQNTMVQGAELNLPINMIFKADQSIFKSTQIESKQAGRDRLNQSECDSRDLSSAYGSSYNRQPQKSQVVIGEDVFKLDEILHSVSDQSSVSDRDHIQIPLIKQESLTHTDTLQTEVYDSPDLRPGFGDTSSTLYKLIPTQVELARRESNQRRHSALALPGFKQECDNNLDLSLRIEEQENLNIEQANQLEPTSKRSESQISKATAAFVNPGQVVNQTGSPTFSNKILNFRSHSREEVSTSSRRRKTKMHKSVSQFIPAHLAFAGKGSQSTPAVPSHLQRQQTVDIAARSRAESIQAFQDEHHKILSRAVDKLILGDNKPNQGSRNTSNSIQEQNHEESSNENLDKILFEDDIQSKSDEESYWALEVDEFGFENMSFSIVDKETIRLQESKLLTQVVWNKRKAFNKALTRMGTLLSMKKFQDNRREMLGQKSQTTMMLNRSGTMLSKVMKLAKQTSTRALSMTKLPEMKNKQQSVYIKPQPDQQLIESTTTYQTGNEIYIILKREYPLQNVAPTEKLKFVTKQPCFINISAEMSIDAMKLKKTVQDSLDKTISSSQYSVQKIRPKTFQKQQSAKMTRQNKWVNASIYYNDLRNRIVPLSGSIVGIEDEDLILWSSIENSDYNQIEEMIKTHPIFNPETFDQKKTKEQEEDLVSIIKNEHFKKADLFQFHGLVTLKGLYQEAPMSRMKFQRCYIEYLQRIIGESQFASYSQHLWSFSQAKKQLYVIQGDRAQNFFKSALKHDRRGLNQVVQNSQARIAPFMRRKTISDEINDTLFQRRIMLLFDNNYVKFNNRPIVIEKIRKTIQKTCRNENSYQVHLRMQELNQLSKDMTLFSNSSKPKQHTSFSKMLIFINFHPPDELKPWIHQEYMDSLKKQDMDTPRNYGSKVIKKIMPVVNPFKSLSTYVPLQHRTSFNRQTSLSARGLNLNRHNTNTMMQTNENDIETTPVSMPAKKAFPFLLNDCFGYRTIVLTDGCYQLLVPTKPSIKPQLRRGASSSARSGNCLSASPKDHGNNTFMNITAGDASPVTFYHQGIQAESREMSFARLTGQPQQSQPTQQSQSNTLLQQPQQLSTNNATQQFMHANSMKQASKESFQSQPPENKIKILDEFSSTKQLLPQKQKKIGDEIANAAGEQNNNSQTSSLLSVFSSPLGKIGETKPNGFTGISGALVFKSNNNNANASNTLSNVSFQSQDKQQTSSTKKESQEKVKENSNLQAKIGEGLVTNDDSGEQKKPAISFTFQNMQQQSVLKHKTDSFPEDWNNNQAIAGIMKKSSLKPSLQTTAKITAENKQKESLTANDNEKLIGLGKIDFDESSADFEVDGKDQVFSFDLSEESLDGHQFSRFPLDKATKGRRFTAKASASCSTNNSLLDEISPHCAKKYQKFSKRSTGNLSAGSPDNNDDLSPSYMNRHHRPFKQITDDKRHQSFGQAMNSFQRKSKEFKSPFARMQTQVPKAFEEKTCSHKPYKPLKSVQVKNVRREVIYSMDHLQNEKMGANTRAKLKNLGIKINQVKPIFIGYPAIGGTMASNNNSIQISPGRNSSSPQRKGTEKKRKRQITVVKQMNVEDNVKDSIVGNLNQDVGKFKNAIHLQETKGPKNTLQAIFKLGRQGTQQQKSQDKSETQNNPLSQLIGQKFKGTVQNVHNVQNPKNRNFFKYQVSKPKSCVNLLVTKSPMQRIIEKQEFESKLEQQERNKVFRAIEFNQIQVVENYIKSHMLGCDVTDAHENTLLSIAAQYGCHDICKLLIKEGANVNTQNYLGNTPLHYTIASNSSDISDLFIENGANETIKNKRRLTCWQGI